MLNGESISREHITTDSAEQAQQRVRRLSQLALLAGFGMLGIITVLVAYTYTIHSTSAALERRLMECRNAIQRSLLGINIDSTANLADIVEISSSPEGGEWLHDLKMASRQLAALVDEPALENYKGELVVSTDGLQDWHKRSLEWKRRQLETKEAADLQFEHLSHLVSQLKSDVETEKGQERLKAVLEFRKAIVVGNIDQIAQVANNAIRASSSSHLESDVANLQLGLLELAGETDSSRLAGIVQNQIRPRLLRLKSSVTDANLRRLVREIEDKLFRHENGSTTENRNSDGLVLLQEKLAHLQLEKRDLLTQVQACISILNTEQERIDQAALQLSDRLGTHFVYAVGIVWTIICLCAISASAVFWRMGKRVSSHICNQVKTLNGVANELSQEKVILTVTQQRLERELTNHKLTQQERERLFSELASASRQAGMAEMATSVLHNVGNVLNSVNVSAHVVSEKLKKNRAMALEQACQLIDEHHTDLGSFFSHDDRGRKIPEYLSRLADVMKNENEDALKELVCLEGHVDHIKQIVNTQQSFAKATNLQEPLDLSQLMEDALKINNSSLIRHEVTVFREYEELDQIVTDRNKVLQILVNLIKNAKQSVCQTKEAEDRWIRLRVFGQSDEFVAIQVIDNGIGIAAESMPKMFTHGFTTKKNGHGFGLHSGALTAKELGGALSVESEGLGKGASFTLQLPRLNIESVVLINNQPHSEELSEQAVVVQTT
ncbi:GHKL domain-containing protein [bacterium]|nr:GHKL domain-containing protein [bacterium]